MKEFEEIKEYLDSEYVSYELDAFIRLPKRAQELLWCIATFHDNKEFPMLYASLPDLEKLTPIEMLFYIAYEYVTMKTENKLAPITDKKITDKDYPIELKMCVFGLVNQAEINIENNKYFADFLFDDSLYGKTIPFVKDIKLIIECDGFEYHHKNKKQVDNDYKRQIALQNAGYDVIRFSGSQLYKDPIGCAETAFNYLVNKVKKSMEKDV